MKLAFGIFNVVHGAMLIGLFAGPLYGSIPYSLTLLTFVIQIAGGGAIAASWFAERD